MNTVKTLSGLVAISLFVLVGCGFAIEEHITGNYYLVAADEPEQTCLCYHEEAEGSGWSDIIEQSVFAVGYNERYMIVKQHPRIFPNAPNMKITNYYILPLKKGMDWSTKNGLIGPLTLEQFNIKRKELKIGDDLTFTKEIDDLKKYR